MTTAADVRKALAATSIPVDVIEHLAGEAAELWLMSEPSVELLASDLALCHPALKSKEVRARAVPVGRLGAWRITIVARDRAGLLADTTGVIASADMAVTAASAVSFGDGTLALHSLRVSTPDLDQARWEELGRRLQAAANGQAARPRFVPTGVADVTAASGPECLTLVTVNAADQRGLLSAICRGLADQSVNIEVARVASVHGVARDLFLVRGEVDVTVLAAQLSVTGRLALVESACGLAGRLPLVGGLIRRTLESVM